MQSSDRGRLSACLMACAELYGKAVTKSAAELWFSALREIPIEAIEDAFSRHIKSPDAGQYMPKPADVVRLIQGSTLDAAQRAWTKVDGAVRAVGPYRSVAFDDEVIHCVVRDMGGWIALCGKDDEAWPFVGNDFVARYRGYRTTAAAAEFPPHLVGISEMHNAKAGYRIDLPLLIGDEAKARWVMAQGDKRPALRITDIGATLRLIAGSRA